MKEKNTNNNFDFGGLFEFGTNENGEYVNLAQEEKQKNDLSEQQLNEWINSHENPLIRIADHYFCGYEWDGHCYKDIADRLEAIVKTKCYHYGNMEKGLYIFSLYDKLTDRYILVFENEKHYLGFGCNDFFLIESQEGATIQDCDLDDYLMGKQTIKFPALYCPCFDLQGNRIEEYCDNPYQNDIRHIVCIKEWQMDKYSFNRIQKDKKVKDFYEVEFYLHDLINYFGEEIKGD